MNGRVRITVITAFAVIFVAAAAPAHASDDQCASAGSGAVAGSVAHNGSGTVVEAPMTRVETDEERTRVTVRAPATDVDVDTERREVRIRVPYFDGVIRW